MKNHLRKPVLAPFLITLSVGFLALWMAAFSKLFLPFYSRGQLSDRIMFIVMAIMLLVEAFLLWRLRRKVSYRGIARAYILVLAFAYIVPFMGNTIYSWHRILTMHWDVNTIVAIYLVQSFIFVIAFLASQILFLILLVTTRSTPAPRVSPDSPNLLDDYAS